MPTNPAERLRDILRSWQTSVAAKTSRGMESNEAYALAMHAEAFRCLDQIDLWISSPENAEYADDMRAAHAAWFKAVLHYNNSWVSNASGFPEKSALAAVAGNMNSAVAGVAKPDPETLGALVEELLEATASDPKIDAYFRWQLQRTIAHVRRLLDNWDEASKYDVAFACMDLKIYCDAAQARPLSDKMKTAAFKLATYVGVFVAGHAVDLALEEAARRALEAIQ